MIQFWILTFNRPKSLNRLIDNLWSQNKPKIYVFNNAPVAHIDYPNRVALQVDNHMGTNESTSWCARSWNSIYIKALERGDEIVCLQDDTNVGPNFVSWITEQSKKYDFMFGPAGDQFHFINKSVIQNVGWWDERYNGCYCADADYLRRVWLRHQRERISVEESHGWGFYHNVSGIYDNVIARTPNNVPDPDYINQHTQLENIAKIKDKDKYTTNHVVAQARDNFFTKWGCELTDHTPVINGGVQGYPNITEFDWYPWASKKYGIKVY